MFLMFVGVLNYAGATAHYSDSQTNQSGDLSAQIESVGGTSAIIRDCEVVFAENRKTEKEVWTANDTGLPTTIASLKPQIVQVMRYDNFPMVNIQVSGGFNHRGLMIFLTNTPPDFLPEMSSWTVTKIAENIFEYRE